MLLAWSPRDGRLCFARIPLGHAGTDAGSLACRLEVPRNAALDSPPLAILGLRAAIQFTCYADRSCGGGLLRRLGLPAG